MDYRDGIVKLKRPSHGTGIILMTPESEEAFSMIQRRFLDPSFIRVYFKPRFIDSELTNTVIRSDRDYYYGKIKELGLISKTIKVPTFIRDQTSIWDLSSDISFLQNDKRLSSFSKRYEAFKRYLKKSLSEVSELFDDLVLFIPAFESFSVKEEKDNIVSALLFNLLNENPKYFEAYKNLTLVLFSRNSNHLAKIITNSSQTKKDFTGVNMIKVRSLMRTIISIENNSKLNTEDYSNTSEIRDEPITSHSKDEIIDRHVVFFNDSKESLVKTGSTGMRVYSSVLAAIAAKLDELSPLIEAETKDNGDMELKIPTIEFSSSDRALDWIMDVLKGQFLLGIPLNRVDFENSDDVITIKGTIKDAERVPVRKFLLSKLKDSDSHIRFVFDDKITKLVIKADKDLFKLSLSSAIFENLTSTRKPNLNPSAQEIEVVDDIKSLVLDKIVDKEPMSGENINDYSARVLKEFEEDSEIQDSLEKVNRFRRFSNHNVLDKNIVEGLKNRQDESEFLIDGQTVDEVINNEPLNVDPLPVELRNEYIKRNLVDNLDKIYRNDLRVKDMEDIFKHFSKDPNLPIFVDKIEVIDSSNPFNLKETVEVTFTVPKKKPQKFRIEVPKITSDGYLFTNGTKKFVTKQLVPLPIVKIKSSGEDVVQFTTNYNKMFMGRLGTNLNPELNALIKALIKHPKGKKYKATIGSNGNENDKFLNNLEYNEIEKKVVKIESDKIAVNFNRNSLKKSMGDLETKGILDLTSLDSFIKEFSLVPFGYADSGESILLARQDGKVASLPIKAKALPKSASSLNIIYNSIADLILNELVNEEAIMAEYNRPTSTKKFMYSYVRVSGRKIPLIVFLAYNVGLDKVIEDYNIETSFSPKKDKRFDRAIRFKDGYLNFNSPSLKYSLLLSGLEEISPKDFTLDDVQKDGNAYRDYFFNIGSPNLGKALKNFFTIFIDPITEKVLRDHDIPDTMEEALLYCNTLLESAKVLKKNDIQGYRMRGAEVINGMLYKILADTIRKYRDSSNSTSSTVGITTRSDSLMQALNDSPIIEPVSTLNPVEEAMNRSKATYKGPTGSQFGHARGTEEVRAYDSSMVGVLSPTTTDDNKVGITRYVSMNPSITSARGYISTEGRKKDPSNMLNIAEMLAPYSPQHADPPRFGMQVRQTAHMISTVKAHKPLVGSGAERTLAYALGDDFVYRADNSGKIEKIDEKNNLVHIKYENGSKSLIDTSPKNSRTSDGFFITTSLKLSDGLKVGSSFKKDQILALDNSFFSKDAVFTPGRLSKVAIAPLDMTFEDSTVITQGLADDLASNITYSKSISLAPSTNIEKMKKVGDSIRTSEPIMIFEEAFEDDSGSIGKLLDKLGDEFAESISEYSKSTVSSKYSGQIVDMRIYYNRELEDFSPSIRKLINSYKKSNEEKFKAIADTSNDRAILLPNIEKVDGNKVNGLEFDGVLIIYYIKTLDEYRPGSKVTVSVALKSITASVIDEGEEPYSELARDEPIDLVISPLSLASRMVPDTYLLGYSNKGLMNLKERIREMVSK